MVCCIVSYKGVSHPVFVNPEQTKVNAENYTNHLKDDLILQNVEHFIRQTLIFVQDRAPSHTSSLCQNFLKTTIGDRFITKQSWPPYFPDCNPLDYYIWSALRIKVYEDRRDPFQDLNELQERIQAVWNE